MILRTQGFSGRWGEILCGSVLWASCGAGPWTLEMYLADQELDWAFVAEPLPTV